MFVIILFIFFAWLFFKVAKLMLKIAWGTTKLLASILLFFSIPLLIVCFLFFGTVTLLIPIATLAGTLLLLKVCL